MGAELCIGQGTDRFSQLHGLRYKRNASLLATGDEKVSMIALLRLSD